MKPRLKRLNTHGYTALNHNGKEFNQISCIQINVYFNIAQEERSFPIKIYLTLLLTIFWESKKKINIFEVRIRSVKTKFEIKMLSAVMIIVVVVLSLSHV